MRSIEEYQQKVEFVFCDLDDTLTNNGMLEDDAYAALWKLHKNNIKIIPITGRPAGWCEMIARWWPVLAVIGENGAFYFQYDRQQKKMLRQYSQSKQLRRANQDKLYKLKEKILQEVPGAALASDQFCRVMDIAVDFCEDVEQLSKEDIQKIVDIFENAGAKAKISSIHVNAWFGDHDKLSMCKTFCEQSLQMKWEEMLKKAVFIGDSPNDAPMFAAFPQSVGVANIQDFQGQIKDLPAYVCSKRAGKGFVEFSKRLLDIL